MQWDTISDQWLWIGAAVVFVIFVAAIAARSLRKPKPHDKTAGRQLGESILQILNQLAISFSR
jgi:hypothetical protein